MEALATPSVDTVTPVAKPVSLDEDHIIRRAVGVANGDRAGLALVGDGAPDLLEMLLGQKADLVSRDGLSIRGVDEELTMAAPPTQLAASQDDAPGSVRVPLSALVVLRRSQDDSGEPKLRRVEPWRRPGLVRAIFANSAAIPWSWQRELLGAVPIYEITGPVDALAAQHYCETLLGLEPAATDA